MSLLPLILKQVPAGMQLFFKQTGNTVGYFNPDLIGTESNNNLNTTHRYVSSRIHFPETTQRNGAKMILSITIEKYDHLKKDT